MKNELRLDKIGTDNFLKIKLENKNVKLVFMSLGNPTIIN